MNFWLQEFFIFASAFAAGSVNSVAGGGTLISFPTLVWLGRNPILANTTNAVALWPGSLAGLYGFRREVRGSRFWVLLLSAPSIIGGMIGAFLLLRTSTKTFAAIVPYLLLAATLLLAAQEIITRKLHLGEPNREPHDASRAWLVGAILFQFCVGVYGGYFGAGMGILMLAALGLLGLTDIHQMNGLKNLLAFYINGIAAIYFAVSGAVLWTDVLVMATGAMCGGFFGSGVARRLGRKFVRYLVVLIGVAMSIALFLSRR